MTPNRISTTSLACLLALTALALANLHTVAAACPFDDGSCQEYCNQQGCNLGYCGHFAWIQCICRKCGDEWNWYDKVHYNPDKQVNQTELDSLKLNGSVPLILTNNNAKRAEQQLVAKAKGEAPKGAQQVSSPPTQQVDQSTKPTVSKQATPAAPTKQQEQQQKVTATLTTLLIPDLSDGSKLDLNDIPDENSEKFLDYLTKNHEKLVQATHSVQRGSSSARSASSSSSPPMSSPQDNDDETDGGDESDAEQQVTTPDASSEGEPQAEEAVEIQISSSNNSQPPTQRQSTTTTTTTTTTSARSGSGGARSLASSDDAEEGDQQQASGPMMRLLRMAVAERYPDDIY